MTQPVKASWHGWSVGSSALFASPIPGQPGDDERIGLFVQSDRTTQCIAAFVDPVVASVFSDWMDDALTATGEANTALLRRLESEQPLAFSPAADEPEEDDEGA